MDESLQNYIVHNQYCTLTSNNSVGKGPSPTLVVYAFTTPITLPMLHGGSPKPVHTPPMLQLDEVTYGYVPEIHSESGTEKTEAGSVILCIFSQSVYQPTNVLNKTQFMTSKTLLQVLALGCHPLGVF